MNFSRKTILVVGAALLAACGDKVTVAEYTPPVIAAKVTSVEVAPATATLNIGQTITLTAAVNADVGLATTVTWASSDATKASVSTAGVVTAVAATPGVAICATSTVDTGKKGCASVVVTAPIVAIPASISIASITTAGNLNAPVNPAAVVNQIDIRLNVNPGNQTVSKVVVVVGGIRADSQTFTAAQAAALRYAADEAVTAQTTFPQIVFSINTAAFSATGVPTWANGTRAVQALLYTVQGGATTAATASVATSLTFANIDTYTLALGTWTNTANSAAGFQWRRGSIAASVLPVAYSGRMMTAGSISFGACDATGTRTRALTAPTTGSLWTATFNGADANGPSTSNATGYEFRTLLCPGGSTTTMATGEGFNVTTNDANGTILVGAAPALGYNPSIRLDNNAPGAVTLNTVVIGALNALVAGTRTGGWVNDAVRFTTTVAADAANGVIAVRPADNGVGGTNARAAYAAVDYTTPVGIAESSVALDKTLSVYNRDALGNESVNVDAAFAVDRVAPVISYSSLSVPLNNGGYLNAAAAGAAYTGVSVSDLATAPVVASGFFNLAGQPLMVTWGLRNGAGTTYYCPVNLAYQAATTACVNTAIAPLFNGWFTDTQTSISNLNIPTTNASVVDGYYTQTATVVDQAGNTSAAVTRVFATDGSAAVATLAQTSTTIPADGSNLNYVGTMVDALSLKNYTLASVFTGLLPVVNTGGGLGASQVNFIRPIVAVDAFNSAAFTTTQTLALSVPYLANMQTAVAAGTINAAQTGNVLTNLVAGNQGNVNVVAGSAPIVTPATAVFTGFTWLFDSFQGTSSTSISRDALSSTIGSSRTIQARAVGPTGTFGNPFTKVQWWVYQDPTVATYGTALDLLTNLSNSNAIGGWRLYGETMAATVSDDGTNRTWTYSATFNPDLNHIPWNGATASTFGLIAVGVNGGSGLASASRAFTVVP